MSRQRLREFDRQLRAKVTPKLSNYDFILGDDRTFRRGVAHEGTNSTQIIEFQVGRQGFAGKFTVNLAVFNPDFNAKSSAMPQAGPHSYDCLSDLVQRLGFFCPPRVTFLDRLYRRTPIATDHWWTQHENAQSMRRELADVERLLATDGFAWFEAHTSLPAFRWARNQRELRKKWIATTGSACPPAGFEPEPFPQSPPDYA